MEEPQSDLHILFFHEYPHLHTVNVLSVSYPDSHISHPNTPDFPLTVGEYNLGRILNFVPRSRYIFTL